MKTDYPAICASNARAIAAHVRNGEANGGLTDEGLARFLEGIAVMCEKRTYTRKEIMPLVALITAVHSLR